MAVHSATQDTATNPPPAALTKTVAILTKKSTDDPAITATPPSDADTAAAAQLIQRTYRGYRTRRALNGMTIDASARWVSTVRDAQFRNHMAPRPSGSNPTSPGSPNSNPAVARWKKAGAVFQRAGNDIDPEADSDSDSSSSSSSSSSDDEDAAASAAAQAKKAEKHRKREEARLRHKNQAMMMNISYFLEMVDLKHRYGGNLLVYHNEWKHDTTTNDNFFYWLDYGAGKDLDIDSCPRERLERECVRYLTREERQFYLVKIDSEGRLRWAKNNELLNTTEEYRDSVEGVVPIDSPVPSYSAGPDTTLVESAHENALVPPRRGSASSVGSGSIRHSPRSSLSGDEAHRYPNQVPEGKDGKPVGKAKHIKATHFSTTAVLNKLLRKSIKQNTWIFVADTRFRLYVGIKMSGTFQHSSFLQGSRIAAAGLIQVKDGKLSSLSPLSGHYRPPASNYKHFVSSLKAEGADMSHLKISKSYVILASMETYVKTKTKSKKFLERLVGHKTAEEEKETHDVTTKKK